MNRFDAESYIAHNSQYEQEASKQLHIEGYKNQDTYGQFERFGYRKIMEAFPGVRGMHIDFGCGGGWLLSRTAGLFNKVVGVEPSASAIEIAKEINKGNKNVSYFCEDMVEGFKKLEISGPVFVTTTTVLSHIEDGWVEEFLKLVNTLPKGSILFFAESYGQNIQRKLWHVRNKNWWASRLDNWQMIFSDTGAVSNYGIAGYCVGKENVLAVYGLGQFDKIYWQVQGMFYKVKAGLKYILKSIYLAK